MQQKLFFNSSFFGKHLPSITLFIGTFGIATYKITFLLFLRLSFFPLKLYYLLFFGSLLFLIIQTIKIKKALVQKISFFLQATIPSEIVLIFIVWKTQAFQSHSIHWLFLLLVNLWQVMLTIYFIYSYSLNFTPQQKTSVKKIPSSQNSSLTTIIFLSLVLLIHFSFGLYHLGKEAYVDERLWTYSNSHRIEKYWNNILEGDWKNTRPSDKPGISLAFLSGPSLLFVTPSDFKDSIPSKSAFIHMLFVMRLPILIFSTVVLLLFYYLLSNLFNSKISLLATTFIGLSPILLGVSRLINPDALSWSIMPLTILSFFNYQKTKRLRWIYLTGILLGWGLLTKYIANLLFLFFILLTFTENILPVKITKKEIKKNIRKSLKALGIISLIALLTFYIFYPGTWVKPNRLLIGTIWSQPFEPIWKYFVTLIGLIIIDYVFNKSNLTTWLNQQLRKLRIFIPLIPWLFLITIIITLYNVYLAGHPIDFEAMLTSPKTAIDDGTFILNFQAFIVSFYVLLFGISPLAFLGVVFAVLAELSKKNREKLSASPYIWYLFLFIIIFYLASIFSTTIAIVRYQIIIYPLIFIVASYGWYYALQFTRKTNLAKYFYWLPGIVILISLFTLYSIRPYYFSYNSPLLPQKYLINIKDMGDGNYEATQYLNNLPNAKNLKIWTDKRGVCQLFIGKNCSSGIGEKSFLKHGPRYDYFVISKGREKRSIKISEIYASGKPNYPIHMRELYESPDDKADFIIHPGNRQANYIKIIPEKNIHVWR